MDSPQEKIDELFQQIESLQKSLQESDTLVHQILEQHQRLLSWAELYDDASPEEKRMISSYIIKAVTLSRGYDIQIDFNISEAQYFNGMEMG